MTYGDGEKLVAPIRQVFLELSTRLAYSNPVSEFQRPLGFFLGFISRFSYFRFVIPVHFGGCNFYRTMIRVVIRMKQIVQNIDVSMSTFERKIFSHFRFQSTIKSYDDARLHVVIFGRVEIYSIFSKQLLRRRVNEFGTLIGL